MFQKYIIAFLLSFVFLSSVACSEATNETTTKKRPTESNIVMKTIDVKGMTCEGCEGAIVGYVTKLDGVVSSKASHVKESVIVKYDEAKIDIESIMKTISTSGYKVDGLKEETPKN